MFPFSNEPFRIHFTKLTAERQKSLATNSPTEKKFLLRKISFKIGVKPLIKEVLFYGGLFTPQFDGNADSSTS